MSQNLVLDQAEFLRVAAPQFGKGESSHGIGTQGNHRRRLVVSGVVCSSLVLARRIGVIQRHVWKCLVCCHRLPTSLQIFEHQGPWPASAGKAELHEWRKEDLSDPK